MKSLKSLINCNEPIKITDMHGNDPVIMILMESEMTQEPHEVSVRLRGRINPDEVSRICKGDRLCETLQAGKILPNYKQIIFNPPATIVLWNDGTKTVVKCDKEDVYDPKYGMMLCFLKRALGNTSRGLNDVLHDILPMAQLAEDGILDLPARGEE